MLTRGKLTSLQHDHHKLILSNLHVYLDHDRCTEVIALLGPSTEMQLRRDDRRHQGSPALPTAYHGRSRGALKFLLDENRRRAHLRRPGESAILCAGTGAIRVRTVAQISSGGTTPPRMLL